ncbi:MAG: GAF domain-containing sensor histidine kinase [Candidatus Lokiarchaeota archaeon]|nr:GAF domain-containing sensor histidine kinase [Candidatus Lokiarchaeota archaeon]
MNDSNNTFLRKDFKDLSKFITHEEIFEKWEILVNIMAKIIQVPVVLIMKVDKLYIEVFCSSESEKNPYKKGDKNYLAGLYCETVIKSRKKLLIPNALKDKNWNMNPEIKLGMVSYLGFPLFYPNGEIFGTICVLDTKENYYSKNIEDLVLQFKELVESHLSLLYLNTKIKKSEEKYRKSYEQVNFYKDLITHDMNNFVNVIQGSIELYSLLNNSPENLRKKESFIELISNSSNKARKLISNISTLSQIQEGQTFSLKEVDIMKFLNEAIKFTHECFHDQEIEVSINAFDKPIIIQANDLLLEVFENILNNAVKFKNNPKIEITIKISKENKEDKDYIKIEFLDNGMGIPDEQKNYIFQKSVVIKKGNGLGFGLSVVKKVIELYNGMIWVEDRLRGDSSQGSNFIIILPKEGF